MKVKVASILGTETSNAYFYGLMQEESSDWPKAVVRMENSSFLITVHLSRILWETE